MDKISPEKVAAELPPLKAFGNRIVNARSGEPVCLRGVNWSSLEYNAQSRIDDIVVDEIRRWGGNVIRLPFNQEWALLHEEYRCALDDVIASCARRGIYTLLDLQWLDAYTVRGHLANGRENFVPSLPDESSVDVWSTLAARYRENPAVLFDIFNEPHDPLPDDTAFSPKNRKVRSREWHPWAARLIEAIRTVHPAALIFVSGLDWGYDLSSFPIDGIGGLVYSSHVYPNKHKSWERAFGRLSRRQPVFVGELGGTEENIAWGAELLAYLDRLEIGWAAWSWCDHPHLIQPGTVIEPTAFGVLVREALAE